jgi:hypothetical protein
MTINAQLLVCDAAQVDSDGKLHILGGGAQVMPLPSPPHTLVVRLMLDAADALTGHRVLLRVIGPDGQPVRVPGGPPATGPAALPGPTMTPLQLLQELPALATSIEELPDWGPVTIPLLFGLGPQMPLGTGPHRWEVVVDDGEPIARAVVLFLPQEQQGGEAPAS